MAPCLAKKTCPGGVMRATPPRLTPSQDDKVDRAPSARDIRGSPALGLWPKLPLLQGCLATLPPSSRGWPAVGGLGGLREFEKLS